MRLQPVIETTYHGPDEVLRNTNNFVYLLPRGVREMSKQQTNLSQVDIITGNVIKKS